MGIKRTSGPYVIHHPSCFGLFICDTRKKPSASVIRKDSLKIERPWEVTQSAEVTIERNRATQVGFGCHLASTKEQQKRCSKQLAASSKGTSWSHRLQTSNSSHQNQFKKRCAKSEVSNIFTLPGSSNQFQAWSLSSVRKLRWTWIPNQTGSIQIQTSSKDHWPSPCHASAAPAMEKERASKQLKYLVKKTSGLEILGSAPMYSQAEFWSRLSSGPSEMAWNLELTLLINAVEEASATSSKTFRFGLCGSNQSLHE